MLKLVMNVSYVLGLVLLLAAAAIRVMTLAGSAPGVEAGNWGIGACALFLCALASARMLDAGRR
jgi:hypothetical protein